MRASSRIIISRQLKIKTAFPSDDGQFLWSINRIKIKSQCISTNNLDSNSNGHSDLLCSIPVNASQYGLINYINYNNFKNIIYNTDITSLDISITDESDNIINFNGIDVHLTIQIDSIVEDFTNDRDLSKLVNLLK